MVLAARYAENKTVRQRQAITRLRLAGGASILRKVGSFTGVFRQVTIESQLFADAVLGTDQGILMPCVMAAIQCCLRLWWLGVGATMTCHCGDQTSREWLAHVIRGNNRLGALAGPGVCGNRGVRNAKRGDQCSQRGCSTRTTKNQTVRCPRCETSYCSDACHRHHHLDRGYLVFCGLAEKHDEWTISTARGFGRWMLEQPRWTVGVAPVDAVLRFVGQAALDRYQAVRVPISGQPIPPVDFLHRDRLTRASCWAGLVHDMIRGLDRPIPVHHLMAAVVSTRGGLLGRDVVEAFLAALVISGRSQLEVNDEYGELAVQLQGGGVPPFWDTQMITRHAYRVGVGDAGTAVIQRLRRQAWGRLASLVAPPSHEYFRCYYFAGGMPPMFQLPLHQADQRRGYGLVFSRLTALIAVETDPSNADDWNIIAQSKSFVTVGNHTLPLLERMRDLVLEQYPGYPRFASATAPRRSLAHSGDPDITVQLVALAVQRIAGDRIMRLVEQTNTGSSGGGDPMAVVRMALVAYLLWEQPGSDHQGVSARLLACTVRTCLYAQNIGGLQVVDVLSTCLATLAHRCVIARSVRRWRRRVQPADRATPAAARYWTAMVTNVESGFPVLRIVDRPDFWSVARLLGDMNAIAHASEQACPDSHARRVWHRVETDRV
jgi:hypothetical protein